MKLQIIEPICGVVNLNTRVFGGIEFTEVRSIEVIERNYKKYSIFFIFPRIILFFLYNTLQRYNDILYQTTYEQLTDNPYIGDFFFFFHQAINQFSLSNTSNIFSLFPEFEIRYFSVDIVSFAMSSIPKFLYALTYVYLILPRISLKYWHIHTCIYK